MRQQDVKKLEGRTKKKSKLYFVSNIISFIYFVVTVVTIIIISGMSILPAKYMILLTVALLAIPLFIFFVQLKNHQFEEFLKMVQLKLEQDCFL